MNTSVWAILRLICTSWAIFGLFVLFWLFIIMTFGYHDRDPMLGSWVIIIGPLSYLAECCRR